MTLLGLNRALRDGCMLHAFRSGGGLRVVRLSGPITKLRGYGEHPNIEKALQLCSQDYEAGGRPYNKVYGGKEPHYLTGSSEPSGALDAWVLKGHTFDALLGPDGIRVDLVGMEHFEAPKETLDRVMAGQGPITWSGRGFTFCASLTAFPNGSPAVSTSVVACPEGVPEHRAFHYRVLKQGYGATFEEAVEKALAAEAEEFPEAKDEC